MGESDQATTILTPGASRTLGATLENRERCSSFDWNESIDVGGRNVVTYICHMRSSASNEILQISYGNIYAGIKSAISSYKQQVELQQKLPPCTFDDEDSARACEMLKQGKLKQISVSENGMERLEEVQDNEIDDVQQVISWGVIKNNPPVAVLLSAKYQIKMDDGHEYELNQGREAMPDVYSNTENLNPVKNLSEQIFPPTCVNCK